MKSIYVKINGIADISKLAIAAGAVDGDVTVRKGKYVVDGKSIMGLFSLDLSTGATVEYPEDATDFENYIVTFKAD